MYKEQPSKITPLITPPMYISYMVRLWCSPGTREWLASLEAPGTHERHNFPSLASLFAFLQAQTCPEDVIQDSAEQRETKDHSSLDLKPP